MTRYWERSLLCEYHLQIFFFGIRQRHDDYHASVPSQRRLKTPIHFLSSEQFQRDVDIDISDGEDAFSGFSSKASIQTLASAVCIASSSGFPPSNKILQRLGSFSFFSCIIPMQSTRAISRSAPRAKQRINSSREVGSISNKACIVCLCTSGLADAQYFLKPLVRSTQAPKSLLSKHLECLSCWKASQALKSL